MTKKYKKFAFEKSQLEDLYIDQRLSVDAIAKKFDCGSYYVYQYLHQYNIHIRSNSENHLGQRAWNKGLTKETDPRLIPTKKRPINWNKGLTKETDERVAISARHISEGVKRSWINPEIRKNHIDGINRPEVKLAKSISCSRENHFNFGQPALKGAGRGINGYYLKRNGESVWLRSNLEFRCAHILDTLELDWKYEDVQFDLVINRPYRPDFHIENKFFWEVKAYWFSDSNRLKQEEFFSLYPNAPVHIITSFDLSLIEYCIDNKINIKLSSIGNKNTDLSCSLPDLAWIDNMYTG